MYAQPCMGHIAGCLVQYISGMMCSVCCISRSLIILGAECRDITCCFCFVQIDKFINLLLS